jgi:hypothetical protein
MLSGLRLALIAVLAVLSSGCLVLSFHPLYETDALAFDDRLLGTWESEETSSVAVVEAGEWRSYRIKYTDRAGTTSLKGYLTDLGGTRFLDVTPSYGLEQSLLFAPLHGFCRIELSGARLLATPIDYDWALRSIDEKGLAGLPAMLDERQNVVITATGKAFREWMRSQIESGSLGAPIAFTKRPTP